MGIKYESFETVENSNVILGFSGNTWRGQTFSPQTAHTLGMVSFYMARIDGSPTGDITFEVYLCSGQEPTGSVLATGTLDASTVVTEAAWYNVIVTGSPALAVDSVYLALGKHPTGDATNNVGIKAITTGGYARGQTQGSNDGGVTWITDAAVNYDGYFKEWSGQSIVAGTEFPTDAITRVTNIIHRYNRAKQVYSMEVSLGEVTSDFGLPEWAEQAQVAYKPKADEPVTVGDVDEIVKDATEPDVVTIEPLPPDYVPPTTIYTCPYCGAGFASYIVMWEHIAAVHTEHPTIEAIE